MLLDDRKKIHKNNGENYVCASFVLCKPTLHLLLSLLRSLRCTRRMSRTEEIRYEHNILVEKSHFRHEVFSDD